APPISETDHAVVDQHLVPWPQHLTDRRRCNRELPVPGAVTDDDGYLFPLGEVERLRKTADPELRALQVADQRKWTADLLLHVPDELRSGRVVVVRPVREVEPGSVHACIHQLTELFRGRAGWADRRDDLRATRRERGHGWRVAPQPVSARHRTARGGV